MTTETRSRPVSLLEQRAQRLQVTVRWAAYWMLGQGGLYVLTGDRMSGWFGLRYEAVMDPYLRLAGLSLLCLGFFILKSMKDVRRQYLAIDTLILYFLGRVFFLLDHRLAYREVFWFEWVSGLVDAGLGGSLVWYRTRSYEMQEAGTLLAGRALDLAKDTQAWVKKQGPPPKVTLGALVPAVETPVDDGIELIVVPLPPPPSPGALSPPAAVPVPSPSAAPSDKRTSSQAVPHMD